MRHRLEGPITTAPPPDWRRLYAGRLALTDLLVLIWVVFGVQIAWFGLDSADATVRASRSDLAVSYTLISLIIIAAWMLLLAVYGTRGPRLLGSGAEEYKMVARASLRLFGSLAIVSYLFQIRFARGYFLIALPAGILVLFLSRWMWRQWLGANRRGGQHSANVLLVGTATSVTQIGLELARVPSAGYRVVAACVPAGRAGAILPGTGIRVHGPLDTVMAALAATGADTVVLTGSSGLTPLQIRELSWGLEPGRHHLVVAPGLTDLGGPRINTRPVAGLPLIHVETPRFEGGKRFAKRAFDLIVGGMLLLVLSPVMAVTALSIRLVGVGPVLTREQRIGSGGRPLTLLGFRSADARRPGGRRRRFGLNEFPQLFSVLAGTMSLVGPRAPHEDEVTGFDSLEHRRFLMKPGMTGLGELYEQSALPWEERLRLDMYYIENWSIMGDVIILWRTAQAARRRTGTRSTRR
ncbi:sugar transferase [Cryobacterium sp. RTS3]|uniref:sugar transferase n=1 Tax=Cryobacterium sp. RTS3 TaxID=3048643 RepID=UPI002B23D35D|nr:sugar transferase [Cryobacterium sp. RTS3]MEB0001066.1 sugar transferase [Cryobacterium sp. RTS3]